MFLNFVKKKKKKKKILSPTYMKFAINELH